MTRQTKLTLICREARVSETGVRNRLRMGMSLDEAIAACQKTARGPYLKPVNWWQPEYSAVAELMRMWRR
jgi:hypothetical protein